MRIAIVTNTATVSVDRLPRDLASDREMEVVPAAVELALRSRGHITRVFGASLEIGAACKAWGAEIALNLAEGFASTNGHEHLVPALLDYSGVRYTGANAANMLQLRDKLLTRFVLERHGVACPPCEVVRTASDLKHTRVDFPVILKPSREEASHGIFYSSVVSDVEELSARTSILLEAYRQPIIVEKFIEGREFSVGVIGNSEIRCLPIVEFMFPGAPITEAFRSFERKWLGGQEEIIAAGDLTHSEAEQLADITRLVHRTFDCRDYSRADFRMDRYRNIYFLEHNFNPGIGPHRDGLSNTFTKMAECAGVSYEEMLECIVQTAIRRHARNAH